MIVYKLSVCPRLVWLVHYVDCILSSNIDLEYKSLFELRSSMTRDVTQTTDLVTGSYPC